MHKFWLVAKQEFRNRTFRRSFLFGTLVIPVLIAVIITITIIILIRSEDTRPLGYVDFSGAFSDATMPQNNKESVDIIEYKDEENARRALVTKDIQGFFILPKAAATVPRTEGSPSTSELMRGSNARRS